MKEKLLPKIPLIMMSSLGLLSIFFTIKAITNYTFLMSGQFTGSIISFVLFGDSTQPGRIGFWLSTAWLIISWLISTKFKLFQTKKWRFIWFWNMCVGVTFHFLWLVTAPVFNSLIPYLGEKILQMDVDNLWMAVAVGNPQNLLTTVLFIPTVVTLVSLVWLFGQYSQYSPELKEALWKFEFKHPILQRIFKLDEKEQWPDVVLGPSSETKELIVQPGRDRTLNNAIIGSIGTGKTAALVLPILNQDLHWMSRYINKYPYLYKLESFHSENIKGMYLNGISVIEPSNDLCQKAYQLVKAHGIPESAVFYIDPTNPDTPNINPMEGPVEKVAEAFAMVIEGLAEGGQSNFFFQQSERNHLKHYIYLLKLHDPEQEVTFDMLLKMYDNANLVRTMHERLKKTFPSQPELIENRDERNHWAIVKQIDEWFDTNLIQLTERVGSKSIPKLVTEGEYRGQPEYYDAKSEYVQGLRNILNDIGASPLIRRVLFGKSDFSFDKHLESGGVLLVNTAKGELGGLSNVLGKLVLLSLQNAVFRRKPNVSNFHHILVDEFPDLIYRSFKEFPAQSRKYKTIITVVAQTVAQLADKYGETYMHTLLGTLRHKMVYGDIPDFDAQLFSKIFGEVERFEEGVSEQAVSPLQEQPMLRVGNSYQKIKEAIMSPSDIIFQKRFQCAVKIVVNNDPIPVTQIDANFVPKEEFEEAIITVDEEAAKIWLEERNNLIKTEQVELIEEFNLLEEDEKEIILPKEISGVQGVEKEPLLVTSGKDHPVDLTTNYEHMNSTITKTVQVQPEESITNSKDFVQLEESNSIKFKNKPDNIENDISPTVNQEISAKRVIKVPKNDSYPRKHSPALSNLKDEQYGLELELKTELEKVPASSEILDKQDVNERKVTSTEKRPEILFSDYEE